MKRKGRAAPQKDCTEQNVSAESNDQDESAAGPGSAVGAHIFYPSVNTPQTTMTGQGKQVSNLSLNRKLKMARPRASAAL